jgi:2-polyprenyl-3-methyl-5-hydroxy-6-metoxy-1,4-benzoquinol methylase
MEKQQSEMTGLEQTYIYHHTKGGRRGRTMFGEQRGVFLREAIGTGKTILDIGCRDGELTREFYKGNKVLGIDIDLEALAKIKQELGIDTDKIDLHGNWNLPTESFDVVVAGEVLEHLYYPQIVLGKVADVLKSDGILVGSVPNAFSLINRTRLFFGIKKGTPLNDPTHINHFKRSELERLLKEQFANVEILPLGKYAWLDKFFPGFFSFMFLFKASHKK